jgi:hypothetical protein
MANSPGFDNKMIYFHLHQATHWAELYHTKQFFLASGEMDQHLSEVKYQNRRLVDSPFYQDFIYLIKLQLKLDQSKKLEIEKFRNRLHSKAESLGLDHPESWQDEFLIVR